MSLAEGLILGLLGVFLASFLGHFSIVLKDIIFVPLFITLATNHFSHPLLLGFVGGLGGGLGELSAYLIGRGIVKVAGSRAKEVDPPGWVKKLGLLSVLVFSLTPIPDAPLLMLLGSARFPVLAVLALEIVGKTIFYSVVAVGGAIFYSLLAGILPVPWDSVVVISASVGLSVVVTWERTRKPLFRFAKRAFDRFSERRRKRGSSK
jgi:membrane protein YqaA with SNARE-associated domain